MRFVTRIFYSLPLMAIVALCMFGFIDTLEPMPRAQQFLWRSIFSVAGVVALATIVWMSLKPRHPSAAS
jgi:hypothetical protein